MLRQFDHVQILGREYYQTRFGETYLVLAPLTLHPIAAITKRLLGPNAPRKVTSTLSLTGYVIVPLLVAHFFVHRVFPTDPAMPIAAVGPSELDYEFVKVSLQTLPFASWVGYAGLTFAVALHAVEGMRIIWNTRIREVLGRWTLDVYARVAVAASVALPVLSGVFIMSTEPIMAFIGLTSRYQAVLSKAFFMPKF